MTLAWLFVSDTGTIVPKWQWHDCSQMTLTLLFPSETATIAPKWHWHNCSQVTMTRLLSGETCTIVPKWRWHDWSQVSQARLFPNETQLFACETDTITSNGILTLICIFFSNLFIGTILHWWVSVEKNRAMYQDCGIWSTRYVWKPVRNFGKLPAW